MRFPKPFSAALLALSGAVASGQGPRDSDGPLLLAPGPVRPSAPARRPELRVPAERLRPSIPPTIARPVPGVYDRHDHDHGGAVVRDRDDPVAKASVWHQNIFGGAASSSEVAEWRDYFRKGGSESGLLASMLASDEYFDRHGRSFEHWFVAATTAATAPVGPYELARWRDVYLRDRDRTALMQRYLDASGVFAAVDRGRPHDHGHDHDHGSPFPTGGGRFDDYGDLGRGFDGGGFDAHEGHSHSAAYGPHTTAYGPVAGVAAPSPPDLIAGWYRTYNGRDVQPHEMDKWLSDLNKGMPLDEVYASVLGGGEWFARCGSSDPQWVASTLEALGQPADRAAVGYWLDRLGRRGDRFRVALEMVRTPARDSARGPAAGLDRGGSYYFTLEPDRRDRRERRRADRDD